MSVLTLTLVGIIFFMKDILSDILCYPPPPTPSSHFSSITGDLDGGVGWQLHLCTTEGRTGGYTWQTNKRIGTDWNHKSQIQFTP